MGYVFVCRDSLKSTEVLQPLFQKVHEYPKSERLLFLFESIFMNTHFFFNSIGGRGTVCGASIQ